MTQQIENLLTALDHTLELQETALKEAKRYRDLIHFHLAQEHYGSAVETAGEGYLLLASNATTSLSASQYEQISLGLYLLLSAHLALLPTPAGAGMA